jgi:hypothetical protein
VSTLNELFDASSIETVKSSETTETEKVEEVSEETETKDVEEKVEETEETQEVKETKSSKDEETKTSIDWDSDDNPLKGEVDSLKNQLTTFEKRWKDTHAWGNEKNKELIEAQNKLREYGETIETSDVNEADLEKAQETLQAKIDASTEAATAQFGQEHLNEKLFSPDSDWQRILSLEPVNDYRVKYAKSPIHEALKVVKEYEFSKKYGMEPEEIIANIEKEQEAKLREKITKEFHDKLKTKDKIPQTLSDVTSTEVTKETEQVHKPLGEVFAQRG